MKVLSGTKREVTLMEWKEIIDKAMKRANDSAECFRLYSDPSELEMLIEDCEKIIEKAKKTIEVIEFMDKHGIK